MKLHEMTADMILEELEKRGDAYVEAKASAARYESMHDQRKAATYSAIRKVQGCSVEDAKAQTLNDEGVVRAVEQWLSAERDKDKAYLALERARQAVELYRTVRSDLRRV